jgi:cyclic pyranopterin phosphate synthase
MGGKPRLSHFDPAGRARMVDVGAKPETDRVAVAAGFIACGAETAERIGAGAIGKGDVLGVARLAAIGGLKRTSELIPLCHPVRVTGVDLDLELQRAPEPGVRIRATVRARDRTGVEMEALTAVAIAALTIYDMCKAIDRGMEIGPIWLEKKSGGRSGDFARKPPRA